METFPKWMEDDYRKIANKGPLSTLIFGHRFKSDQTLYEYLTEFLLVFVSAKNADLVETKIINEINNILINIKRIFSVAEANQLTVFF